MTNQNREESGDGTKTDPNVVIIGRDGTPVSGPANAAGSPSSSDGDGDGEGEVEENERHITDLVEQPAKVMRIGSMIRQLLDEVKAAPLDEASRARLKEIHQSSIEELERLALPFNEHTTPSESELRIAQAQLVGWLEGLFHGIQTAIYAQQVAARAQLEQMRRALPPGLVPDEAALQAAQQAAAQAGQQGGGQPGQGGQQRPGQGHS